MSNVILLATTEATTTAVGAKAEEVVLRLLIQFLAILATTQVVVRMVRRLGQTDVAGEILAGLLLGPSFLGAVAPGALHKLFDPSTASIFVGFSQIGLVLLMFQIGLEFEFGTNLRASKRSVAVVSAAGIVAPFALGLLTAPWFHSELPEPRPDFLGFRLFFAVAMSITAIPVLGRIFMELRLSHTRTAAITVGAAAVDDVVGWLLLGVVTMVVEDHLAVGTLLVRIGLLFAYLTAVFLIVRPLLKKALCAHLGAHGALQPQAVAFVLLALFGSAIMTSLMGVFAIIGGFVIGAAVHDDRAFVEQWRKSVTPIVNTLFVPLFFASTGLRTDIHGLATARDWMVCGLVLAVAFVAKLGGAYVGARLVGEVHRSAMAIAVSMNTRALMELVAINIGYDLGVMPRKMFTMLVIMAIGSTFVATPLIRWLLRAERVSPPATDSERLPGGAAV